MFRSRKPSKTSLQRESLTIETNDIIGDHQVSDHYTANSTVCFANFSQVLPPNSSAQIAAFSMSSVIDNQRKSSGYLRLAALVHHLQATFTFTADQGDFAKKWCNRLFYDPTDKLFQPTLITIDAT